MLKQKSKLLLAVMLLGSVAFISCNGEAEKKADAPAVDSAATPMTEQKMEPAAKPDSAVKVMDSTMGDTKPVVPGK